MGCKSSKQAGTPAGGGKVAEKPTYDFEITVEIKAPADKHGLELDPFDGGLLNIKGIDESGLVGANNKSGPNVVAAGDKVAIVNGIFGDSNKMLDEINKKKGPLKLAIKKGAQKPEAAEAPANPPAEPQAETPAPATAEANAVETKKEEAPVGNVDEAAPVEGWVWTEQGIKFMMEANKHETFGKPEVGMAVTVANKKMLEEMGIWNAVIDREVIARSGDGAGEGEQEKRVNPNKFSCC